MDKPDLIAETWAPIPGFDGMYDASDQGRIRTWRNNRWGRLREPRILKCGRTNYGNGYRRVTLMTPDGRSTYWLVHRVVLLAFVGEPVGEAREGAHRNGIPHDNRLANLYWATPKQNGEDNARLGVSKGELHGNARLTDRKVRQAVAMAQAGMIQKDIAATLGVSRSNISAVLRGRTWTHVTETLDLPGVGTGGRRNLRDAWGLAT